MKSKQVIVIRTDLRNTNGQKIRTGKIISQCCHASMKVILDMMNSVPNMKYINSDGDIGEDVKHLNIEGGSALNDWINGIFTKVCVSVDSENELISIYESAKSMGIPCSMIEDVGLTEFGGVVTKTSVAVGPGWSEDIDKITGHLKLL